MRWNHPILGSVLPIPSWSAPEKTWKHLLNPCENWAPVLGRGPHELLRELGGGSLLPWTEEGMVNTVEAVVPLHRCHDAHWAEVYGRELLRADTRCARSLASTRWVLASTKGVYLVVEREPAAYVVTAYRPLPLGRRVPLSEDGFRRRAASIWEKETGMSPIDLANRLTAAPVDAEGVWELALAVAEARGTADPQVLAALADAERFLATVSGAVRGEACPGREEVLDALERMVRGEAEHAPAGLIGVEEAVLVTEVLAGEADVSALLEGLRALLDWIEPGTWLELGPFAAHRATVVTGAGSSWWVALAEAIEAAELASLPSRSPTTAALVGSLLPPTWSEWLNDLLSRVGATPVPSAWTTAAQSLRDATAHEVRPPRTFVLAPGQRVFVVDAEHPRGEEVTGDLRAGLAAWHLERPGDECRVVVVSGVGLDAADLAAVLERAPATPGAAVHVAVVSRST